MEEAAVAARSFLEAYYQVDDYTAEITVEALERCKPYLTEMANELFLKNRETQVITDLAKLEKTNITADKIDLTALEDGGDADKVAFDFAAEVKLVSPGDGAENFMTFNGYLETEKEDGAWKVSHIRGHRPKL